MTIYQIIEYLKGIALSQPNVNSSGEGDIYEFYNANPSVKYATFFLTQGQHSETESEDRYALTLFYTDRLADDGSNKLQIQSTGKEVLSNIIRTFVEEFDADTETIQYQPFTQRFNDMCAGVYATLTFEVQKDSVCSDGYAKIIRIKNQTKAVKYTKNGHYEVLPDADYSGMDKVIVDVDVKGGSAPVFESLVATENKVYTPKEGVDGFDSVKVDVPDREINTEIKIVSITSNGQTVIDKSADKDGMTQVFVNTNVEAKAPVLGVLKASENKIYEAPSDIDGWNRVEVAVPMPEIPKLEENKAVQIVSNGQTTVVPSTGYEGLKKAVITVDVPSKEPKLQEKTTNRNGEVLPDQGYDGMSKVNVNVPIPTFDTEELRVIENGTYTPSTDGFSKVVVDVPIPVEKKIEGRKTVDVVENGTVQIVPSVDFDGIAGATVNVNVPTGGSCNLQAKSVTTNGKVVADAGYDGLSEVDVNVPQTSGGNLDLTGTGWDTEPTFYVNINRIGTLESDLDYTRTKFSEWNPSNTSASMKYYNDKTLVYAPLIDTSNVTNMYWCFKGCLNLTSVPKFDTSKVISMYSMFDGCTSLASVPLFDTSKVTDISYMFGSCSSLTSVPLLDTSKVTDMTRMFHNCSNLIYVPLFNTSKVTDMNGMFDGCSNLIYVPLFDTSKVTDMKYMFGSCSSLTSLGGFIGLKCSLNLSYCPKLTKQSLLNVINNLATVIYETLELGATNLEKLTEEEIAIATAKGWTVK